MQTKKIIKTAALFFALALVMLLVFSCGTNNAEEDQDGGNSNRGTPAEPSGANGGGGGNYENGDGEPSEFVPARETFEGYDFRIIGFGSYEDGWRAMTYCETWVESMNSDPINDAIYHRNALVEELYDITISNVPLCYGDRGSHARIALNYLMSGDDIFDAGLTVASSLATILRAPNATTNLFELDGIDLNRSWWDHSAVSAFSVGGELRTVTGDISLYNAFARNAFAFNKQMAEDYNLGCLYTLVREGGWTWDKVEQMSRQVAKDLDSNNRIDHNDQVGLVTGHGFILIAINSAGVLLAEKDGDDMPALNMNHNRIIDIIDKIMPIIRDPNVGFVAVDLSGRYGNPYYEFVMPKFRDGELLFYTFSLLNALDLRDMEIDFGILPFPKVDERQDRYYSVVSDAFSTMLWIPETSADPERTATIIEAMGYYSQQRVIPAFYEVTISYKALRDEDSLEMLQMIRDTLIYDLGTLYNWGDYVSIFGDMMARRTFRNDFASSFDRIRDRIENDLQETLNDLR
jgi:hypothetical protein